MVCDSRICTGCGACANICPNDSIKIDTDEMGFLMPVVDTDSCNKCNLCKNVCPNTNAGSIPDNITDPVAFACWIKDEAILLNSTSGGMFALLSEFVLERDGLVAGCIYDTVRNRAYHKITDDINEVRKMSGSKYIQSETGRVYKGVKSELENGRYILFTGCPCQVAGLYGYLGKKYEGLITVDLVCHGAASYKIFNKYINEIQLEYGSKITDIKFRSKIRGWDKFTVALAFEDGKKVYIPSYRDKYMKCYYHRAIYRDSCYQCRYARFPRVGDFTMGDYSGVPASIAGRKAHKRGISLLLINNGKSEKIFGQVKSKIEYIERPLEEAISTNYNLARPSVRPKNSEIILNSSEKLKEIADKYCSYSWKARLAAVLGPGASAGLKKITHSLKQKFK